jgi:hypothetical protein
MAKAEAQMAFDEAAKARLVSENTRSNLEQLLDEIRNFLITDGATPADIELVIIVKLFIS